MIPCVGARWTRWAFALSVAVLLAVGGPAVAQAIPQGVLNPAAAALREQLAVLPAAADARNGAGSTALRAAVVALYERRAYAPLWTDAARADRLRAALDASPAHGLDRRDYHRAALSDLKIPDAAGAARDRALARRDVLLTDAFIRLAYHLSYGKVDPRALSRSWNFARRPTGADAYAALAARADAVDPAAELENLAPALSRYRELREALERLHEVQRTGAWPTIAAGPKLEPGASGSRVAQLRARFQAEGLTAGATPDPSRYDDALAEAVRRFQSLHGIEPDAVVGKDTLAALNTGVAERIAQIGANLERLRWIARDLKGDHLIVDVAGFEAQLWLDGAEAWSARVVVGQPFRKTPEFRARMQYLVLNPEWNVPPTILREDIAPKLAKDPEYLQKHRMRVVGRNGQAIDPASVEWSEAADGPASHRIVQSAGAHNSLGRVKFMFPNEHSVYLHDTPTRELFERTRRAYSSGCIRVENPLRLAELLLDDPQRWGQPQLEAAVAGGRTQTVSVRRDVPVMLLYFTAQVESDGALHFRPDLYKRDQPIIRALAASAAYP